MAVNWLDVYNVYTDKRDKNLTRLRIIKQHYFMFIDFENVS